MNKRTLGLARGIGVIAATAAIMIGATFASLSSTATLSSNTINSATSSLLLWNGSDFTQSAQGFNISKLAPGQTSDPFNFYFKNAGDVDLSLTVQTANSSGTIDATKVTLHFKDLSTGDNNDIKLSDLNSGAQPLSDVLPAGTQGNAGDPTHAGNYQVTATLDPSVSTGGQTAKFDLVFTGTQT